MSMLIADSDPANIECVVSGRGVALDLIAQASAQAWAEFDTTQVHQVQAYGSGARQVPAEIPRTLATPSGALAAWMPAQRELFCTNGSLQRGGSYLTLTVSGHAVRGPAEVSLARAVALVALSAAPRGPSPAPSN
ncbi:MAG: hypothetical protein ACRDMX_03825 [Solirubrobacteraceae bacterium]